MKTVISTAILSVFIGIMPALAGERSVMSDHQMGQVTAGGGGFLFFVSSTDITNGGSILTNIDPVPCGGCFLNIQNESFTLQAQFGPIAGPGSFIFLSH